MYNKMYVKKLFYKDLNSDFLVQRLDKETIRKNISSILSKIFYDVESFKYNKKITIKDEFNGNFVYLGEIFTEKFNTYAYAKNGLINSFDNMQVTTIFGFNIKFFDDVFIVTTNNINDYFYVKDLMKQKYQKRYVEELYKIFGDDYKKHYLDIKTDKDKRIKEFAMHINNF